MKNVNRRTFLAGAGSGAAALAMVNPRALGGSAKVGPNDRLRVAVIGLHGRGESHVQAFAKHKLTEIVTLCDVDTREFGKRAKQVEDLTGKAPKCVQDFRQVLDDPTIQIISIAVPNHWHALMTVLACQKGKDVYVEKPCSHNVVEGRKIVDAARKYDRIVQHGTQSRSSAGVREAMEFLHSGKLGKIVLAKGLCYKPRGSIGVLAETPVPPGVNYDLWLGPAAERPFHPNRFHYNWHWNWDFGNGDIGNQGVHQMDVARWGLNKMESPAKIFSAGGRLGYKDDGETPNTQIAAFRYDDCLLEFEVRGLLTNDEKNVKIGNIFYGTEGYLTINGSQWSTYLGKEGAAGPKGDGGGDHFDNFLQAVTSRDARRLHANPVEGHLSSSLGHLANIAYRLGRELNFDPKTETFPTDDEANALLTRKYRSPYLMPEVV